MKIEEHSPFKKLLMKFDKMWAFMESLMDIGNKKKC